MNNLSLVVRYCENYTVCRRQQLLDYFGETGFNVANCRRSSATVCDNCSHLPSDDEAVAVDAMPEAKRPYKKHMAKTNHLFLLGKFALGGMRKNI